MLADAVATVIAVIGLLVLGIGWFSTVREMFAESRAYGYGAFLVPILTLVYAALHWEDLKRQFWFQIAGYALIGTSIGIRAWGGGT